MGRALIVVGGGWAGLAAAVAAVDAGWHVTVLEASRHWGGRARRLPLTAPDGTRWTLDNGQHILIGAYTATLALMRRVGVEPTAMLQQVPLTLRYADGSGLALPGWARLLRGAGAPLALAAALLTVRGWPWSARLAALRWAARQARRGFACDTWATVTDLCVGLPPSVTQTLIEPLCVAALNTPIAHASGTVFLRVLHDALRGPAAAPYGPSDLLLPRTDLGALLPDAAVAWLQRAGARLRPGARATALSSSAGGGWWVETADGASHPADAVVLAAPVIESARLLRTACVDRAPWRHAAEAWIEDAETIAHQPIATVYVEPPSAWAWPAPVPMLALRADARRAPAQFVFHRTDSATGRRYLAFVASAPDAGLATDRAAMTAAVQRQAMHELALSGGRWLATVVEKRATFACTPGLRRPPAAIAPGLLAAGDAIDGPYPATLEGAVRSGYTAVAALSGSDAPPA
ncbi:hydroxysqualene dehydroxylase HpnE [Tepidimonas taiwanensis]|uniref:HpnE: squalene-associated FAD-dependent desaturase n=1 Tax=Tepidimonas taiwanensis TaxID=307486 RepID=A0A554X1L1_9BURK|nr:hydroxysqualene dehydroxylase HpnE [Tepidimonas taiwanensis]MCX7693664.1 hydroxysqualene dehydroxylase HpnE [Tepidimonas taiwanensis]MDM7462052.1 hydroxysqualene dehydroxylase HpnE [Tepidimonas taiwanensis]TSE29752.1 HpnE: squalene-associated FAD-dependent desaturase [Tepidimonas taiwanensis]UBQ04309.1 hydroxysqualene dehydroxylase HpnE [Tepidimonas taiwanensis]